MFTAAIESVFQLDVLVVIAMAAVYGIAIGAIPGLTATMAVALMVPLTFYLDDVQAIAAIVTTVNCSIFAGGVYQPHWSGSQAHRHRQLMPMTPMH